MEEALIPKVPFKNCPIRTRTPRLVRWELTRKGKDTLPILMSFIAFGAKWHSDIVFEDRQPRTPEELFPNRVKFAPVIKNV